jgi:hypothetical protein
MPCTATPARRGDRLAADPRASRSAARDGAEPVVELNRAWSSPKSRARRRRSNASSRSRSSSTISFMPCARSCCGDSGVMPKPPWRTRRDRAQRQRARESVPARTLRGHCEELTASRVISPRAIASAEPRARAGTPWHRARHRNR